MVRSGETTEVERLYREHGERLWRAVFAFAGDREVANDAVAEAFAQVLRRGAEVRDPLAWVWRVAFRIAAGELKRRRADALVTPEESYEMSDKAADLLTALDRLSPRQRGALVLHHYAGYRIAEVASILGSTPQAVRVHLFRGRRRLRELLGDTRD